MDKDNIIKNIYYDPAGYSSVQKTYQDAREKDSSIKLQDVKNWFVKNVERTKQLKGYNSFINDEAFEEFQVDIMFMKAGELEPVLVMIDIFSKYAVVIPIPSKETPDVIAGVMEGFVKMSGKPKMIYSDNEGALNSNLFKEFCDDEKIKLITTRTHAWVVERFIRTLKHMINLRTKNNDKSWKDVLFEVLLTYNNKNVHSSTGFTPKEARLDTNRLNVKANLEMPRTSRRTYPELFVNNEVKLYKKETAFDKENKFAWLPTTHTVALITYSFGQKYYHI